MTLQPLPDTFTATRDAMHQLAYFAIAPKRYAATGRLGLRSSPGVFGTPPWDDGDQVWVTPTHVVARRSGTEQQVPITSVRDVTTWLDIAYDEAWFGFHDPLTPRDPDTPLGVDPAAAQALSDWFDLGAEILEAVRVAPGAIEPSEVQLWPEHFDPATERGSVDAGRRASYGASPGDAAHPEPYLYVSPWTKADRSEPYWNDDAFGGASLTYTQLRGADDPVAVGRDFLLRGARLLEG